MKEPIQVRGHAQGQLLSQWAQTFQRRLKQNVFVRLSPPKASPERDARQVEGLSLRKGTFHPEGRSDQGTSTTIQEERLQK
jgi:hypothetical protein